MTYEELLADNQRLREQLAKSQQEMLAELVQQLLDEPLVRVKAEAFEYRIYEMEMDYMMTLANTPESQAKYEAVERVKANYCCAYPDRPLNPKPRPVEGAVPSYSPPPQFGPPAKPRKPYTRRAKAA